MAIQRFTCLPGVVYNLRTDSGISLTDGERYLFQQVGGDTVRFIPQLTTDTAPEIGDTGLLLPDQWVLTHTVEADETIYVYCIGSVQSSLVIEKG